MTTKSSFGTVRLWAKHDKDQTKGPFQVTARRAKEVNDQGEYGVFWTPNEHVGPRKIENVTKLLFWYVELDGGDTARQSLAISTSPLRPSFVVSSKAGFHAYWAVQGDVDLDTWSEVTRRLVYHYKADRKCKDPTRLLRAPGFYHNKGEPYMVELVWCSELTYTTEQMVSAYKPAPPPKVFDPTKGVGLAEFDGRVMLPRLNGHWLQNGEEFYLVPQANGNCNVYRSDGYSTGVFIDQEGLFGNCLFGPTLVDWLRWYGTADEKTIRAELMKLISNEERLDEGTAK